MPRVTHFPIGPTSYTIIDNFPQTANCGPMFVKKDIAKMRNFIFWTKKVPKISWLLLLIALLAGACTHFQNPYGIFLYTPRDFCHEQRSHAFSIGYLAILGAGFVVSALFAIVGFIACVVFTQEGGSGYLRRVIAPSLVTLIMVLVAAPTGTILGNLLPLKVDPLCHRQSGLPEHK